MDLGLKALIYQQTKGRLNHFKRLNLRQENSLEYKSDIINWLGRIFDLKSYLEISTYTTGGEFLYVDSEIFTAKKCVNYVHENIPVLKKEATSIKKDHDFKLQSYEDCILDVEKSTQLFEVILVDGYHCFEQTIKDIENALRFLKDDGFIVLHDCNPDQKSKTGNDFHKGAWCGQTYAAFIHFRYNNPQYQSMVLNIDEGCGIIRKNKEVKHKVDYQSPIVDFDRWEVFDLNRKSLLNLIEDVESFKIEILKEENSIEFLVGIVLFNQDLSDSSTFKSIINCELNKNYKLQICIYDNSPCHQSIETHQREYSNIELFYVHDPENAGVHKAYNFFADYAEKRQMAYMTFFDQDSIIPLDFFRKLYIAICENPTIGLFAPTVISNEKVVSPNFGRRVSWVEKRKKAGIFKSRRKNVINSGMTVSLEVFRKLGGYHASFPFYFSDVYFTYKYGLNYQVFYLMDVTILHDMVFASNDRVEILARYKKMRKDYIAYAQLVHSIRPVFSFYSLGLRLALRFKDLTFIKYMFSQSKSHITD